MNNRNAKEDFLSAFWVLYQKKAIEKISVRELCELAGYNRTTFYVYFKDIYDLLEQFIEIKVLPEDLGIEISNLLSNVEIIQKIMCYFFAKNNCYLQVILKQHHNYVLQEAIIARIKTLIQIDSKEEIEYAVRYQMSAILGVLEFWYKQGENQISDEKLLTLIYEISTKGVLNVVFQTANP